MVKKSSGRSETSRDKSSSKENNPKEIQKNRNFSSNKSGRSGGSRSKRRASTSDIRDMRQKPDDFDQQQRQKFNVPSFIFSENTSDNLMKKENDRGARKPSESATKKSSNGITTISTNSSRSSNSKAKSNNRKNSTQNSSSRRSHDPNQIPTNNHSPSDHPNVEIVLRAVGVLMAERSIIPVGILWSTFDKY